MYWGHFLWELCGHWSSALVSGLHHVAGGKMDSPVRSTAAECLPKVPGVGANDYCVCTASLQKQSLFCSVCFRKQPCCKDKTIAHQQTSESKWQLRIHVSCRIVLSSSQPVHIFQKFLLCSYSPLNLWWTPVNWSVTTCCASLEASLGSSSGLSTSPEPHPATVHFT